MKQIEKELQKIEKYLASNKHEQISLSDIRNQLDLFINGVKIPQLVKPCTVNDGIIKLESKNFSELVGFYKLASDEDKIIKFVPASGAASRMFQKLQSVFNKYTELSLDDIKKKIDADDECKSVYEFLINLKNFAFYEDLKSILKIDELTMQSLINNSPVKIIDAVLFERGLNYSSKPKGAIKFHKYNSESRTAFEEQIYESFNYLSEKSSTVKIHFTISEEHTELFKSITESLKSKLKSTNKIDLSFSYQKKSTNTIAVDTENQIIFDNQYNPIFRPGGHGALLENLNDLNADIVIIKNIDNISIENFAADTSLYKKLLTGFLVKIQSKIFEFLRIIERKDFSRSDTNSIMRFAEERLFVIKPNDYENWNDENRLQFLFNKLNRPIRVCGMVKNEGEPGGGPFWVKGDTNGLSLQIIEQAQIDINNENQKNIFMQSTHFNPVDLICGVKDFKGKSFNLNNFVDPKSGIITTKSKDGIKLKALELPGLWNGSMANWITIFVEVPISTFNPVKEINDLLRKEHQN